MKKLKVTEDDCRTIDIYLKEMRLAGYLASEEWAYFLGKQHAGLLGNETCHRMAGLATHIRTGPYVVLDYNMQAKRNVWWVTVQEGPACFTAYFGRLDSALARMSKWAREYLDG